MPRFIRWVPTEEQLFDGFFGLAPVSSSDVVYDLGSGDGRLLFAALERGAGKCIGIEIDSEQIKISRATQARNPRTKRRVSGSVCIASTTRRRMQQKSPASSGIRIDESRAWRR